LVNSEEFILTEKNIVRKIRIGCIGVGQIGKHHLENYSNIEDAEIVAIADVDEAELQRVAELYNVPHAYTDFRELLKRDDIDAVDVCLHNNLHRPVTVAALEAGKHVYCEKPIAGSYLDAQVMYDTAKGLGLKLSIQLRFLFDNEVKAARALVDHGMLGKPYHARSTGYRRRGRPYVDGYGTATFVQKAQAAGGALYDMGVYHIAEVLYLLDNPAPLRISGKTYQETVIDPERLASSGYDVEELGIGFVRMEGDLTLNIIEAWAIHLDAFEGSFVVGDKGGVRLRPFGFFHSAGDLDLSATADLGLFNFRWQNVRGYGEAYEGPQRHWIAALQGRVDLLPTAELALNTMLISEGIYLSSELDCEVTVEEVKQSSISTAVSV
jgi:predicted dehydrogenase